MFHAAELLPLALLSVRTEDIWSITWSGNFLVVLLALSVFGTSLPFWLWFAALKQVQLNRANAFRFLIPVFGLAIAAVFFDERLGWVAAAGAVLILTGVALVQHDTRGRAA